MTTCLHDRTQFFVIELPQDRVHEFVLYISAAMQFYQFCPPGFVDAAQGLFVARD